MKLTIKGIGRKNTIFISVLMFCIAALGFLFYYSIALKKELRALRARTDEMALIKTEYEAVKARVDALEAKKSLTKTEGIVQAVDEVFGSIGLKGKVKSVKPTASREIEGAVEEEAEIIIEKVNMNEAVNIFYRLETAPMLISVKRASFKTTFENPSFVNLSITASLIRPK